MENKVAVYAAEELLKHYEEEYMKLFTSVGELRQVLTVMTASLNRKVEQINELEEALYGETQEDIF